MSYVIVLQEAESLQVCTFFVATDNTEWPHCRVLANCMSYTHHTLPHNSSPLASDPDLHAGLGMRLHYHQWLRSLWHTQLRTLFGWMTLPMRVRRTLFSKLLRLRDCTIRSRRGIHDPACFVICKYGTTTSEIDTVKQSYVEPASCTQLINKLSFEQKHIIHFPHLLVCLFVCASLME